MPTTLVHIMTVPQTLALIDGQVRVARRESFEIHAVASPGAPLERFGDEVGVPVHAVDMPRRISPLRDLVAVGRLYRLLRRIRPQIVHAHTPKAGLLGMLAARAARVPVRVYQMRGLLTLTARGPRRSLLRAAERLTCRLADQVICQSHSLRAAALAQGLCDPRCSRVLLNGGNGVDAEYRFDPERWAASGAALRTDLGIGPEARVVGYVGRLVRDKGVVELAAAWRLLRRDYPDAHLLLVGPDEERDRVPGPTRRALRSDGRVHLLGEQARVESCYAAMSVLALPTYREGLSNVLLEAAAMRLPAVASRVTGCVDAIVDGETGALVTAADAGALATALRSYLDSPELRRSHGEAGRLHVLRHFRPEPIWRAQIELYRTLLAAVGDNGSRPAVA